MSPGKESFLLCFVVHLATYGLSSRFQRLLRSLLKQPPEKLGVIFFDGAYHFSNFVQLGASSPQKGPSGPLKAPL